MYQVTSTNACNSSNAIATTDTITTNGTTERFATEIPPIITTTNTGGSNNTGNVAGALTAIAGYKSSGKNEVILYQKVSMGTGKQAGNPWLLELPDPITRATWDNYALISTAKAKELDIDYTGVDFEYYQNRPLIELQPIIKRSPYR